MAVVERYRAVMAELVELGLEALDVPDLFAVLDATEAGRCQLPVITTGWPTASTNCP
jgi:hypothetical protein